MTTTGTELRIPTNKHLEILDITAEVEGAVATLELRDGLVLVHLPHATAALVLAEHEPGLLRDLEQAVRDLVPWDRAWAHDRIDDNAAAHLVSAFVGAGRTLPLANGRLVRGTWQNILLIELDGPRNRRVIVQAVGH